MSDDADPAARIDAKVEELADWRGAVLSRVRALIKEADPEVVEDVKWRKPSNPAGVPTWSHGGLICTGETYKDKVKFTFMKGSLVDDPAGLFNMGAGVRRAIDVFEGDAIDEAAFKTLFLAAVALNTEGAA